jgi:hypothetical protein
MTRVRPKAPNDVELQFDSGHRRQEQADASKKPTDRSEDEQILRHRGKPRHFMERLVPQGRLVTRVVEAPREIKSFPYFMAWHPRLTNEPAQKWFPEQLRSAVRTV